MGVILLTLNFILLSKVNRLYLNDYVIQEIPPYTNFLFGDSHGNALDQRLQPGGIFNFSDGSDSYIDMERKLNFLLKSIKVDTIYLSVDNHSLAQYRDRLNNHPRSIFYVHLNRNNFFELIPKRYLVYNNPTYLDLIMQSFKAIIINQHTQNESKPKQWQDFSEIERIKASSFRYRMQFGNQERSHKISEALANIITLCNENNITIIGIKFPLDGVYYDIINGKNFKADSMLRSAGFEVWDYSQFFLKQPELFNDQDHLNQTGAELFTTEILDRIKY
ncbi:hypothetical protein [uncultured Roseivirga sp.]|uniref:hypothetical protein n=1 Tax=uncultured Roseivirga sp. TaxID=543088 RepID=UPI00258A8A56|nr:hypothetical protein [uncultured Roseivirga sp.]